MTDTSKTPRFTDKQIQSFLDWVHRPTSEIHRIVVYLRDELTTTLSENERLKARVGELEELHRMQLAAITTAACANTREAWDQHKIDSTNPYWTVAYGDVLYAISREIRERHRAEQAESLLKQYREAEMPEEPKFLSFSVGASAQAYVAYNKQLRAYCVRLRVEGERDAKDAGRYRFWRLRGIMFNDDTLRGEAHLDKATDEEIAALASQAERGEKKP